MAVRIMTDSTVDLSEELINEYGVIVIPLNVVMGDESCLDDRNLTQEKLFEWSDANKATPKTSAPSIGFVEDYLKPAQDAGDEIVYIGISEAMSSTCQVIRLAASDLDYDNVFVVDSKNLSTGVALMVLRACDLAKEGKSGQEIADIIAVERDKVRASFCIDTLTYLHRGGRCGGVAMLIGATLMLKPMIAVKDGKMGVEKKYRGKISKVLKEYVKELEPQMRDAVPDRVFITHTADDETVKEIRGMVEELGIFEHVYDTKAGGVISSHCGPGTLGVLFVSK